MIKDMTEQEINEIISDSDKAKEFHKKWFEEIMNEPSDIFYDYQKKHQVDIMEPLINDKLTEKK